MIRRNFLKNSLLLGTMTVVGTASINEALANEKEKIKMEKIIHSVYFWLKDGITIEEEQEFLKYFEILRNIPGASSLTFGKPAPTKVRDVTDNTFDYNLIITFDKLSDINAYENHPEHVKGAHSYQKFWKRVQVRDTLVKQHK